MVISDWEMPTMDGLDLCRAIRVCRFGGYVYTIILASPGQGGSIIGGVWAGADDFLVKPFHPQELVVRVRAGERILALEAREVALFALAKLAEWRGPEADGHLERVRMYSQVLADVLSEVRKEGYEVDGPFIRRIYQASPLHDIGIIGIRDAALPGPGKLSDQGFDVLKFHTLIGAATLDAALRQYPEDEFLSMARDIAIAHHERYDGTGYPHGLVDGKIPLAARIVALADAYDILTTPRVYGRPFSHEQARSRIREKAGAHFDPAIVSAFAACEATFNQIRKTYTENRDPEMNRYGAQGVSAVRGAPVILASGETRSPRPGDKAAAAPRAPRLRGRRGFSLIDTLLSSVVLVVAVLGNSNYRYQSMLMAQRADMWRTAATVAQLLCQSWAGVQGVDTYNPVSALSPAITLQSGTGPSVGTGFTGLGSYQIDLNGTRYFATLSWQDVGPGLRALNVRVSWSQSRRDSTTCADADKSFALTAYHVTP